MRRPPPLSALRAFEAAARLLSFGKAAAELGVTPTAVSHQIRALEDLCGQKLFRRRPRPIALTAAGQELYPSVHEAFDALGAAVDALARTGAARPLRVTTTNAFAHRWLVPRLALWRAERPDLPLEIIGTDAVVDVAKGEADLAIRYMGDPPAGLVSTVLMRDRFWPICTPAFLAAGPPVRAPADLARRTLVHLEWNGWEGHSPTWARWFAAAGVPHRDWQEPDAPGALRFREELHGIEAIIAGQGIAVTSDVLTARELAAGTLVRAFDIALPGYGYHLCHARQTRRERDIGAFSAWLRSVA
ncbi:LysR substrate-binding domain-containing protein [Roseomonas rosulenta]|uniref:LysR substrate-binding domain-containing protein n=1 Tax=Roseomonas rosulenta TaxID=2748667 RepID=UPI0018E03BC4|nr:LysR substrate-binding domain-containing protein [Roseomonas rosulenta]